MVEPTHLKKILVKLDHFPKDRDENKNIWNHHLYISIYSWLRQVYLDSLTYQTFRIDASNSFHWLSVPISEFLLFLIHFQTIIYLKTNVKSFRISIDVPHFKFWKHINHLDKGLHFVWRHPHQASSSLSSSSSCFTFRLRFQLRRIGGHLPSSGPKKTKITRRRD